MPLKKHYLMAIVTMAVIGVSIPIMSEVTTTPTAIPTNEEPIKFKSTPLDKEALSKFPRPSPPPMNLVDRGISLDMVKNKFPFANNMPQELPTGEEFVYGTYDMMYDEATLYYANAGISSLLTNQASVPDMVNFGMVVFNYERLNNLSEKIDRLDTNKHSFFNNVPSGNTGYFKNGNDQMIIVYAEDGIELSITKDNASPRELKSLVRALGL